MLPAHGPPVLLGSGQQVRQVLPAHTVTTSAAAEVGQLLLKPLPLTQLHMCVAEHDRKSSIVMYASRHWHVLACGKLLPVTYTLQEP